MPRVKEPSAYDKFQGALRQVLQVSKADMTRMLAEEKIANQDKPKRGPKPKPSQPSASDHASGETD